MKHRIYLDYNATTPLSSEVEKAMKQAFKEYGNASSLYQRGRTAKEALEKARTQVATCIGARPETLIFTGSGTESNNQVIASLFHNACKAKKPCHILYSEIEHSSVKNTLQFYQTLGLEIDTIPVNAEGQIQLNVLKEKIKPNTALISVMMVNNETGHIQPIQDIVAIAKERDILVHTDAVQALGKLPFNCQDLDIDFLSISAHKIYGPKGVGALYVKNTDHLLPHEIGGGHERKLRAGTENIPGIVGFGTACETLHIPNLSLKKKTWIKTLKNSIPMIQIHNENGISIDNTLSLGFPGLDGHAIAIALDLEGIEVSTGSACSVGAIEPSHVLKAMGISDDLNRSSIRISFGKDTTDEEQKTTIETLTKIIQRMCN